MKRRVGVTLRRSLVVVAGFMAGMASAFISSGGGSLQRRAALASMASRQRTAKRPLRMILEELAPADRKENMPAHIRRVLQDPRAPKRVPENDERTNKIRARAKQASEDALAGVGFPRAHLR